tara:strand:- start:4931 stop:5170 length:240 start_codon:yes stop_codon:yes gene_type:complete
MTFTVIQSFLLHKVYKEFPVSKLNNDTVSDAEKRAEACFNAGLNIHANPYRNMGEGELASSLFIAFETRFKELHQARKA